jgi:predicted kinase
MPSALGTSENRLRSGMDCMLDALQLPGKLMKHYFAFWQQYAGAQTVISFWTTPQLYLYKFSSHLAVNTPCHHYEDQLIVVV